MATTTRDDIPMVMTPKGKRKVTRKSIPLRNGSTVVIKGKKSSPYKASGLNIAIYG